MLPQNQLDGLPDADALRAEGVVYAYRRGTLLVTFQSEPRAVAAALVRHAQQRASAPRHPPFALIDDLAA
jgi:hypothetical protein